MIKQTVYIPYHQKLDELCDFVFQTISMLLKRGYEVKMILYDYAYVFGDSYDKQMFVDAYIKLLKNSKFTIIRPFIHIVPGKGLRRLFKLNQIFFQNYLIREMSRIRNSILWIFWPEDADLVKQIKPKHNQITCLYDCVDYFTSINPELRKIIELQENYLIEKSDFVFVNSRTLYKVKSMQRTDIQRVPSGFDEASFMKAGLDRSPKIEKMFAHIPKPVIGFCGAMTFRIDYLLLHELIKKTQKVSFVFIGPIKKFPYEQDGIKTEELINKLRAFPNFYLLPSTDNKVETAKVIGQFDIGIIPYDPKFDFNTFSFPMKTFEYFYMGKPVISTPIVELKRFSRYVHIGDSWKEWEKHIQALGKHPWPNRYRSEQRKLAVANSWEEKTERILSYI